MKRGFLNNKKAQKEALYPVGPLTNRVPSPASNVAPALPSGEYRASYLGANLLKIIILIPGHKPVGRLPYGKVENTGALPSDLKIYYKPTRIALPASYTPAKFAACEFPAIPSDYPVNTMLLATIPMCFDGKPSDPDGHSEWIVHAPTVTKVFNAPGYPQPVPKPTGNVKPYTVKSTLTMGKGIFATRDIPMGGMVFAERPLLVVPTALTASPIVDTNDFSLMEYAKVILLQQEQQLEVAVARMEPGRRAKLMALMNSHSEDGCGPITGIVRTNGYAVKNLWDGDGEPEGDAPHPRYYSAVCDVGSRINHRFHFFSLFFRLADANLFCLLVAAPTSTMNSISPLLLWSSLPFEMSKRVNSSSIRTAASKNLHPNERLCLRPTAS